MAEQDPNRYVSFQGIDCDGRAADILSAIQQYIDSPPYESPWLEYFRDKLRDRAALGQDDLYFVGSQINNIHALFEEYEDQAALHLLEQVEEECC